MFFNGQIVPDYVVWVNILYSGTRIHEMHHKYVKGWLCGNCWEAADGLLHCEHTETGRQAWKTKQQPLQMTPWETGVTKHDTNSTARTLQWEPDSHLYCQQKGYFWKMGPSPWFNSLTNPRKKCLSLGRLCDLDLDYTLVWIFSRSASSHSQRHMCTHTNAHLDKFHFNFIMGWRRKQQAMKRENVSWRRFMFSM